MQKKYCIYLHRNKFNNKVYIGQTTLLPPQRRWKKDGKGYASCYRFYSAIQKYGWENFEHIILEEGIAEQNEINQKEIQYIKQYNSTNSAKGYNVELGGSNQNEQTRLKNSVAHQGSKNHFAISIGMYDQNWNLIKIFNTRKEVLNFLNIKNHHYLGNARKNGTLYKGYYWKDIDKEKS